jgi:Tfp pilus assembly protein PilF
MESVPELFAIAIQDHQAGRLPQAEQNYRRILEQDPQHVDALHLMGVIAHQVGRHDLAIEWIGR